MQCLNCLKFGPQSLCEATSLANLCRDCRTIDFPQSCKRDKSLWERCRPVAALWDTVRNFPKLSEDIHAGSNLKFYFYCSDCSNSTLSTVQNKTKNYSLTCGSCSRKHRGELNSRPRDKTIADNPELLKEWDSERNLKLPNEVAFKSNRKYFWKCKLFKHSFTASASNRTAGKGCPICKNKHFISKGEKELLEAVKSLYAGRVEENRKYFNYPYETDIVLPDLGIGIEFNGDYWHSDKVLIAKKGVDSKSWHALKRSNAESLGVDLLFVWERDWTRRRAEILEAIERFLTLGEIDQIFRQLS